MLVEAAALNNWLTANYKTLNYEQMKGPREHLYYLIDSRVKQLYAKNSRVFPMEHDPILETLFSWSERLAVFGGSYVFNALRTPNTESMTPLLKLPAGVDLSLNYDLFTVRSNLGWSVTFPYYFMVWNIGYFAATGGTRTQLIALSTGAAKDKTQFGRSQATLLFLFSPSDKFEAMETYWLTKFGIDAGVQPKPLGVNNLKSRSVTDETLHIHKEFTAWSDPSGSYAVAYSGNDGAYEWNRAHFLDFLRSIKTSELGKNGR